MFRIVRMVPNPKITAAAVANLPGLLNLFDDGANLWNGGSYKERIKTKMYKFRKEFHQF